MREFTPDEIRETAGIEKYVQRHIVEAERWQIEASRRWKQALSSTQTASLLKRQATAGVLHADQDGIITTGFPARHP